MANTNTVSTQKTAQFFKRMSDRMRNGKPVLRAISVFYHNATVEQFRAGGGLYGRDAWPPIDPKMYERHKRAKGRGMTKAKIRYGTDGGGGGKEPRRFKPANKPLIASQGYMKSFIQHRLDQTGLVFGSKLEMSDGEKIVDLATKIQYAGRGNRFVLPVWEHSSTQSRVKQILAQFAGWLAKGGIPPS